MEEEKNDPQGPQGTRVLRPSDLPGRASDKASTEARKDDSGSGGPVLVGLTEPFTGLHFPLAAERTQIGRKDHNTIVLDDPSVSWEHAHILFSRGRWWAQNVLSTNGTFVNGEQIHEIELADGDRIAFGNAAFEFRIENKNKSVSSGNRSGGEGSRTLLIAGGIALVVVIGLIAAFAL